MFSWQRERSQQQLGFLGFPVDCLLLAKCKMRCIRCVASPLFLLISHFLIGLGMAKENMKASVVCSCVDREWDFLSWLLIVAVPQ